MSQPQINHSPDLLRLRNEGYEIEVVGGHLVVHHIPYVNSKKEIQYGKLITVLDLNGTVTTKPSNHVIQFMGEHPCNKDGSVIMQIQHGSHNNKLTDEVVIQHSFSNKPQGGYSDYHHKITRYADIISSPAKSIDGNVTAKTFRAVPNKDEESVFNYLDTNATRASIYQINAKFKGHKIGIIGLGGTGSYILDQVAKTSVDEIHLFDADLFHQHNAFRSPGAPSLSKLGEQQTKVEYFKDMYSNMRNGIVAHEVYVDNKNVHLLEGLTYVFICVDSNSARSKIMKCLMKKGIPFIDVGLGVNVVDDKLIGTVRATTVTQLKKDHLENRVALIDIDDNEYATNIQIADLNALNALLAVIKWKKLIGFYQDLNEEHHTTYSINTSQLINEDITA